MTSLDEEVPPPDEDEHDGRNAPSEVTVELGADAGSSPVTWTVATKGSPHAFILGIPGQGKSVTTRRIDPGVCPPGTLLLDPRLPRGHGRRPAPPAPR